MNVVISIKGVVCVQKPKFPQTETKLACNIPWIYVKIDECDYRFLPPAPCSVHRLTGRDTSCLNCISAVQPGIFAVKPLTRKFKYFYDAVAKTNTLKCNASSSRWCLLLHAVVFYARYYSRSWNGGVLNLSSEMQPNHQVAHSLRDAISPKMSGVRPVSGPYCKHTQCP